MSDPITTPLMVKIISGISGLAGGVSFMAFYRPKNVWDAAVRSGISVTSAIVLSPVLIDYFQFNQTMDVMVASSAAIGFCSWSILSMVARLLVDIQDEKVGLKLPEFLERKK